MEEGLSSELLGNPGDISFRQCTQSCPVIVKPRINMIPYKWVDPKLYNPKQKHRKSRNNFIMMDMIAEAEKKPEEKPLTHAQRRKSINAQRKQEIENDALREIGRKPVNWAFSIDYSDESLYMFEQMLDHISNYDTIHLIYCKPPRKNSDFFVSESADTINFIFHSFVSAIRRANFKSNFDKNAVKRSRDIRPATARSHTRLMSQFNMETNLHKTVLTDPNVGSALCGYVNHRKNKIHFLCMYTDMMEKYRTTSSVIGSAADYCVRHARCAVVLPRLPLH